MVLLEVIGFKTYNYHKILIEKKAGIAQRDKRIAELDLKLLESVKLGYEALIRLDYVSVYITYGVRNPHEFSESEFTIIQNKALNSVVEYAIFLNSIGYKKDGKLTKIISEEKSDFQEVSDKAESLRELMEKEDKI